MNSDPRRTAGRARPGAIRAAGILAGFAALTLPLIPVQAALLRTSPRLARRFPRWYHRQVCRLLGLRLDIEGRIAVHAPVLVVSNHVSWLDIPVLSAVAPISFVAKKEVGTWPFVSTLARLQRSVFVDRTRRTAVGDTTSEIMARLQAGDAIVLFAEGTSSDGNHVLPFRSALIGAVHHAIGSSTHHDRVTVQPLSLAYTGLSGLPLGRAGRNRVAWYGDLDLVPHLVRLCAAGAIDVVASWGEPVAYDMSADRKDITRTAERAVREMTVRGHRAARAMAHERSD